MYLKSLVLNGFKSFADKTSINFSNGVTGIVGPNGCGKSNILDSIRWVLGESSAKSLRSNEMADVIFSGTKNRKGIGMAEVILTFSNCENFLNVPHNEISITRRVFKDGKSQYQINKKNCRQKDISNLFLNTGVGQVAYSILEQGKIDQILSSKPEDRRIIIEEAAGIRKFKTQRKESLAKLEYTQTNILRIEDIKNEVDSRKNKAQSQAKRVIKYKKLKNDIKTCELYLSQKKLNKFNSKINESKKQVIQLEEKKHVVEEKIVSVEQTLDKLKIEIRSLQDQIEELHRQKATFENSNFSAKTQIKFNLERIEEYNEFINQLAKDKENYHKNIKSEQLEISKSKKNISELEEIIKEKNNQLNNVSTNNLKSIPNKDNFYQKISDIKLEIESLRKNLISNNSSLESNKSLIINSEKEIEYKDQEFKNIEEKYLLIVKEKSRLDESIETKQNLKIKYDDKLEKLEIFSSELQKSVDSLNDQITPLSKERAKQELNIEFISNQLKSSQSIDHKLKISAHAEVFDKLKADLIAGLIKIEDTELIKILDTICKDTLNTFLINDTSVAIKYTKLTEKDQSISFINIDDLKKLSSHSKKIINYNSDIVKENDNVLYWLIDKVKCPEAIKPLFYKYIIVRDIEPAIKLKIKYPNLSFISLNGDYIDDNGILHLNNFVDNNENILSLQRDQELTKIDYKRNLEKLKIKQNELEKTKSELNDINKEIFSLKKIKQSNDIELTNELATLNNIRRESTFFREKSKELKSKHIQLNEKIEKMNHQNTQFVDSISDIEKKLKNKEDDYKNLNEELQKIQALEGQANNLHKDLSNELSQYKISLNSNLSLETKSQKRIEEYNQSIINNEKKNTEVTKKISELKTQNVNLKSELDVISKNYEQTSESIKRITKERGDKRIEFDKIQTLVDEERKNIYKLGSDLSKEELHLSQFQYKKDSLLEKIQEDYSLELTDVNPLDQKMVECIEINNNLLKQTNKTISNNIKEENEKTIIELGNHIVKLLNDKLKNLGNVNLESLEEFSELEERANYLNDQLKDLIEAKEKLQNFIDEINKTSRKKFKETFSQVRTNFKKMFEDMFGKGSNSDLILLDEKDPLECGIDIIAQPKGKKLQSIRLLSGGERSMTAIALLFAIYLVKPAPFCVLDELDAPLDDANIDRFIKAINIFSKNSQFIIITHNKRTMNSADVLHGVTMQESGVSKMLSIKFTSKEEPKVELSLIN